MPKTKARKPKRRPVKPSKPKPEFNINHPQVAHQIEFAFESAGTKYYRFGKEFQMPTGRYKWVMHYLREVDLRMDLDTMKKYMAGLKKILNGGTTGKMIQLGEAWKIVDKIEARLALAFEPAGIARLASVTFFDDTEDLSGFNFEYGSEKVDKWAKAGTLDFFLTSPIEDILNLKGISTQSLQEYIQEVNLMIQEMTLETPNPSQENLSEDGTKTL
jgi:hypothetical protein